MKEGSLWHPREGSWPGHSQSITVNRLAISAQGNRSESALIKITKGALKIFLNSSKARPGLMSLCSLSASARA